MLDANKVGIIKKIKSIPSTVGNSTLKYTTNEKFKDINKVSDLKSSIEKAPKESCNEDKLIEKIKLFLSKISKEDDRRPKYELMLKEIEERSKEKPLKNLNEEGRMDDTAQLNKDGLPENSKVKGSDKKIEAEKLDLDIKSKAIHVFGPNVEIKHNENEVCIYIGNECKVEGTVEEVNKKLEDMIADKDNMHANVSKHLTTSKKVESKLIKIQNKQYILDILHASLINVNDNKDILKFKDEFELARECQIKAGIDISDDIEEVLYEDEPKETMSKDGMVDNQIGKPENLEKDQKSEEQEIEKIEEDKQPIATESVTSDIWDVSEGIPLGNGYIAHKDKKTNEIYVIDEKGVEQFRAPNALTNDMGLIIEFLRSILKLDEVKASEESLKDKLNKILDDKDDKDENNKDNDENDENNEDSEQGIKDLDNDRDDKINERLAELKKQIMEKNKLVQMVVSYMRANDKDFVSNDEILSYKKPAESIIFAKERATMAKQKIVAKELKTASNATLNLMLKAYKNKNKEEINNVKLKFFKFPELNEN
jgi:nucleotidyltransferase/DNA polymerase involved in DNA repair